MSQTMTIITSIYYIQCTIKENLLLTSIFFPKENTFSKMLSQQASKYNCASEYFLVFFMLTYFECNDITYVPKPTDPSTVACFTERKCTAMSPQMKIHTGHGWTVLHALQSTAEYRTTENNELDYVFFGWVQVSCWSFHDAESWIRSREKKIIILVLRWAGGNVSVQESSPCHHQQDVLQK